jgi:hypothetical protein
MAVTWRWAQDFFEPDGSLLDLYAFDASPRAWGVLIRHLCDNYAVDFEVDGKHAPLPAQVELLFQEGADRAPRLLRVHRTADAVADVNVHFFVDNEIEMDLDPRSVSDQVSLDRVVAFMAGVAGALEMSVVLTPENSPERPILTVDPSGSVRLG